MEEQAADILGLSLSERNDNMDQALAVDMVESLRQGIPPRVGVNAYSVGHEKLLQGISKFQLQNIGSRGFIRFISGSWGAGKTHFFRMLRELAFDRDCMVSTVELSANQAALNRFETVFFEIIRNIYTPKTYQNDVMAIAPFEPVLKEALSTLSDSSEGGLENLTLATQRLMQDPNIDLDFKKMVKNYWDTFVAEGAEEVTLVATRSEIAQWFSGEGRLADFRKRFGVNKMVTKENARLMLQSLAAFVRLMGYAGLVILFDEAEQAYSLMRKASLREAHNNLLSLINNIENIPGLFLVYATTPDFYTDPKHGIDIYGALAGRIGKPEQRPPRAFETVWNIDAESPSLTNYQDVAQRIAAIYRDAYLVDDEPLLQQLEPETLNLWVSELYEMHPSLSAVRFWRVLIAALVSHFDQVMEGEVYTAEQTYDDVMDRLRED